MVIRECFQLLKCFLDPIFTDVGDTAFSGFFHHFYGMILRDCDKRNFVSPADAGSCIGNSLIYCLKIFLNQAYPSVVHVIIYIHIFIKHYTSFIIYS